MLNLKNITKFKKLNSNESGQALLFVVVVLAIALAIGVAISVRTIASLSGTTQTDTAQRVLAASEGGIERFIVASPSDLAAIEADPSAITCAKIGGSVTYNAAEGKCQVIIDGGVTVDTITSAAYVSVSSFSTNKTLPASLGGTPYYGFNLENGFTKEVNLEGYTGDQVEVCFSGLATIYFTTYDSTKINAKGGFYGNSGGPSLSAFPPVRSGFETQDNTSKSPEFSYCKIVDLGSSSNYGLRLRAINQDATVGVFPLSGNLPMQGYKIVSTGLLLENLETVTQKEITAYKSLPYLPSQFDFSVYSGN